MTIYFVHVKKTINTGDKRSSPVFYYPEYFRQFDVKEIDLQELKNLVISPDDFVIVGGGGILDSGKKWNGLINLAMQQTGNVILWGCGFNTSKKQIDFPALDLSNSLLIGIRDYLHPFFRFVPCITCKSKYFDRQYTCKREIGIVKHHSRPLQLHESFADIETISNSENIANIIRFIGESDTVISNSYHVLYWASLLHKKTGRLDPYFNSRFRDCMYQYQGIKTLNDISNCRV